MKTKTTKLLGSLALACCFMITQQATAQSWGNGSGNSADRWTVNSDNSNHWSYLRLQISNTRAWNMINQGEGNEYGSLWWGYAANSDHNDRGFEAMRLYNDGDLRLANRLISGTTPNGFLPAYLDWSDTRGLLVRSGDDNAFFGLVNRVGENGGNDNFNAAIYFGDNPDDDLVFQTYSNGEIMRLTGGGRLGIGTTAPSEKLHISGGKIRLEGSSNTYLSVKETGSNAESRFWTHTDGVLFIQNNNGIRFGALNNSTQYARFLNNGNLGIGTDNPGAMLHVKGDGTQFIVEPGSDTGNDAIAKLIGHRNASNSVNQAQLIFANYDHDDASTESLGMIAGRVTDHSGNTGDMVFYNYADGANAAETMRLTGDGNVGIGTENPSEKLEVSGNIKADGVILNIGSFPDYVFGEHYPLRPLAEVETYVKTRKHLPGFPSEAEVIESGANLGELNHLLVEKVEELTLYTIDQEKQIKALSNELNTLKAQLSELLKKQ